MTAAATVAPPFQYFQPTFRLDQVAEAAQSIDENGFALIPGVMSRAEVEEARREIDRLRPFHFDAQAKPGAGNVDHYKCVFNRSPYWLRYIDGAVVDVAEKSMGEECHIIGMTAWRSHPQGPDGKDPWDINHVMHGMHTDEQLFHADEDLLRSGRVKLPVMLATAHYYLSDIDIELCPTWVLPGSHLNGKRAHAVPPEERVRCRGQEAKPVLCRAGDVLFFRSEVWHTGSRNRTTDRTRYLVQVHYGHRFMAQKFSPYLNFHFNAEVLASCTPRQRKLLGDHKPSNYD
jgi:ectoine hydroxylase-related dioxygenase (phytanoyl-CoA dioxygenase family)